MDNSSTMSQQKLSTPYSDPEDPNSLIGWFFSLFIC